MISLEQLIGRVWELQGKYDDLQHKYQLLIHQYEQLKEAYENCSRHRDMQQVEKDSPNGDKGH